MAICNTYLSDIQTAYSEADYYYGWIETHVDWFYDAWFTHSNFNSEWRGHIYNALNDIKLCIGMLVWTNYMLYEPKRLPYYLEHCIEADEYVLTWKKICEAWVKNDFEGKEWTIACIDRMRQLMWDKPFSIMWAAKPDAPRE